MLHSKLKIKLKHEFAFVHSTKRDSMIVLNFVDGMILKF